jgi:hypothetical protein
MLEGKEEETGRQCCQNPLKFSLCRLVELAAR